MSNPNFECEGKLFIGGISNSTTQGKSRGFGFVIMKDPDSIQNILEKKSHLLDGKYIDIKKAVPKGRIKQNNNQQVQVQNSLIRDSQREETTKINNKQIKKNLKKFTSHEGQKLQIQEKNSDQDDLNSIQNVVQSFNNQENGAKNKNRPELQNSTPEKTEKQSHSFNSTSSQENKKFHDSNLDGSLNSEEIKHNNLFTDKKQQFNDQLCRQNSQILDENTIANDLQTQADQLGYSQKAFQTQDQILKNDVFLNQKNYLNKLTAISEKQQNLINIDKIQESTLKIEDMNNDNQAYNHKDQIQENKRVQQEQEEVLSLSQDNGSNYQKSSYDSEKLLSPQTNSSFEEEIKIITNKIFIGGLQKDVSQQELEDYFTQFGKIKECVIMLDKVNLKPRGFGFVTFENESSVDKVMDEKDKHQINGKWIDCKRAMPVNHKTLQQAKIDKQANIAKINQLKLKEKQSSDKKNSLSRQNDSSCDRDNSSIESRGDRSSFNSNSARSSIINDNQQPQSHKHSTFYQQAQQMQAQSQEQSPFQNSHGSLNQKFQQSYFYPLSNLNPDVKAFQPKIIQQINGPQLNSPGFQSQHQFFQQPFMNNQQQNTFQQQQQLQQQQQKQQFQQQQQFFQSQQYSPPKSNDFVPNYFFNHQQTQDFIPNNACNHHCLMFNPFYLLELFNSEKNLNNNNQQNFYNSQTNNSQSTLSSCISPQQSITQAYLQNQDIFQSQNQQNSFNSNSVQFQSLNMGLTQNNPNSLYNQSVYNSNNNSNSNNNNQHAFSKFTSFNQFDIQNDKKIDENSREGDFLMNSDDSFQNDNSFLSQSQSSFMNNSFDLSQEIINHIQNNNALRQQKQKDLANTIKAKINANHQMFIDHQQTVSSIVEQIITKKDVQEQTTNSLKNNNDNMIDKESSKQSLNIGDEESKQGVIYKKQQECFNLGYGPKKSSKMPALSNHQDRTYKPY